jgi:tetratricopeptide (TPR) repeat protein
MLSTLVGDGVELDPLKRMVIERTEGNPFSIEEMVQALFDEGALVWIYHHIDARHQEAAEMAREMLEVAERRKTPAVLADAHSAHGLTLYWTGHVAEALTAFSQAIALCPDGAGRISFDGADPLVVTLIGAAPGAWIAGYPDRAVTLVESAIKRPRDLNLPFSLVYALLFAAEIRAARGELLEAQRLCEHIEALAEQGGFGGFLILNSLMQGWVAGMQGEHGPGNRDDSQQPRELAAPCVHIEQFKTCRSLRACGPLPGGAGRGCGGERAR